MTPLAGLGCSDGKGGFSGEAAGRGSLGLSNSQCPPKPPRAALERIESLALPPAGEERPLREERAGQVTASQRSRGPCWEQASESPEPAAAGARLPLECSETCQAGWTQAAGFVRGPGGGGGIFISRNAQRAPGCLCGRDWGRG
ncbi:rho GTPase-activating protein 29 [Platysternon megacephalum]|uniref:Rho GTPase-activating protein 29 n=1 Tax=Platysternon megacephalum TaxID=55544 RepID=A0A4D9EFC2_9SAUR|nr:rho GTPase-activating protein 29 [Platysternon megacephalum]